MLTIQVPEREFWNDATQEFVNTPPATLQLEHSLVSLSKWEQKWCVPFLTKDTKSQEQMLDYVRCMTLTENVEPDVYFGLSDYNFQQINEYINAPMTATTFSQRPESSSSEIITAELMYYWMVAYNIPFECETWHLNRFITLVKICNIKNSPQKKMSQAEIAARHRSINASRRAALNSSG